MSIRSVCENALKGKKFFFKGNFGTGALSAAQKIIEAFCGTVSASSTLADYLVLGRDPGLEKGDLDETLAANPDLRIIQYDEFCSNILPQFEHLLEGLQSATLSPSVWNQLPQAYSEATGTSINFAGANFRTINLDRMNWFFSVIDRADFRDSSNLSSTFMPLDGVNFDNSTLSAARFSEMRGCSFRGANMDEVGIAASSTVEDSIFDCASMKRAKVSQVIAINNSFRDCNLERADLSRSKFNGANFSNANMHSVNLSGAVLKNVCLENADLSGADLSDADLSGANLTNANLSTANLACANLTGAIVTRAKFSETNLALTILHAVDTASADSLANSLNSSPVLVCGPKLIQLTDTVTQSKQIEFSFGVENSSTNRTIEFICSPSYCRVSVYRDDGAPIQNTHASLTAAMDFVVVRSGKFRLKLDTLAVKSKKSPISGKQIKQLVHDAICEAFAYDPNNDEAREKLKAAKQEREEADRRKELEAAALREKYLPLLQRGEEGVLEWNKETGTAGQTVTSTGNSPLQCSFKNSQLAMLELPGIRFLTMDFSDSNFSGSNLSNADLQHGSFNKADFSNAKLQGTVLSGAKAKDSNFSGADLTKMAAIGGDFLRANFTLAKLTNAFLCSCNLRGTDFSNADLSNCNFNESLFDETTVFPDDFILSEGLVWDGRSIDPRASARASAVLAGGPVDFQTFMQTLNREIDPDKLLKALDMMKKSKFQLFAEVSTDQLIGVVKSQSDSDLVYSCKLDSQGGYSCYTQNLKVCGGLRGSLCKHLLVLLIGTTKSGQSGTTTNLLAWISASNSRKPLADKETATATFLRFKSAEAGELDWRPTETIPEDYYMF